MRTTRTLLFCLSLLAAPLAWGQNVTHRPEGPWRTVTTDHFRLHYPLVAEEWALEVAGQLDGIRARVSEAVGFEPPKRVDLVVMDPYRDANGFALPLLGRPRMGVYATPPGASSALGNYRSWAEDLVVHEDAHLVHLLRPSRAPFRGFFRRLIGIGPVSTESPAWVVEGYATVIEGRLTGRGRPNSDYRATLLRSLAQEGRMPGYYELDGAPRWGSGGFRYLIGSAYLEWLEAGTDGELPDLWRRMSARRKRSFPGAFEGVFGEDPEVLYGRYVAELTRDAMAIEAARPPEDGTLFADLYQSTGAPTVSSDGKRLAAVVAEEGGPSRLVVWSTEPDPEAAERWEEAQQALLAEDPEDVPAPAPEVFAPTEESRRLRNGLSPVAPRFLPDGRLLFSAWTRNGQGFGRPDLYIWDPAGGEERVTRGASLIEADPHPSGALAYAVQTRWGVQSIVAVDLASGAVTPVTEPSTRVVDGPRVSPDGQRLAYLITGGQDWELRIRELGTGEEEVVELPESAIAAEPAWLPDGSGLVVSLGYGGFIELAIVGRGEPEPLTATRGGAYAPAIGAGEVFFLTMDADGRDIRRMALPTDEDAPAEATPADPAPPVPEAAEPGAEDGQAAEGSETTEVHPEATDTAEEVPADAAAEEVPADAAAEEEPAVDTTSAAAASEEVETVASAREEDAPMPPGASLDLGGVGPLALRPEPPPVQPFPEVESVDVRPYGLGKPQVRPLAGLTFSPHHGSAHLLVSAQDIAGKLDIIAAGGLGLPKPGGVDGLLLTAAYRGPVRVEITRYLFNERRGQLSWGAQGLAASLTREGRWQGGQARLRAGALVDTPAVASRDTRWLAHLDGEAAHRAWVGPLRILAGVKGHGAIGETNGWSWQRAQGEGRLAVGGRTWAFGWRAGQGVASGVGARDGFRLGGIAHTLVPEVTQLGQVLVPAFVPNAAVGDQLRSVAAELEFQGATLAWEYHDVGGSPVELLTLTSGVALEPTPLVGVPAVSVDGGLSCTLRDLAGRVERPCTRLSDYALWATLVWRP